MSVTLRHPFTDLLVGFVQAIKDMQHNTWLNISWLFILGAVRVLGATRGMRDENLVEVISMFENKVENQVAFKHTRVRMKGLVDEFTTWLFTLDVCLKLKEWRAGAW